MAKTPEPREPFRLPDGFFDTLDPVWGEITPDTLPPGLWREVARCRAPGQVFAVLSEYQRTRSDRLSLPSGHFFIQGVMTEKLGGVPKRALPKKRA